MGGKIYIEGSKKEETEMKITVACRTEEDSYESIQMVATVEGKEVGQMSLMVSDGEAYIERIDVEEEEQNKGYGTQMIQYVAGQYDYTYTAPDNEDAKRLYDRLGWKMNEQDYGRIGCYVDQGYGVYEI